jgi:phage terminase large subunit GpA-like protein
MRQRRTSRPPPPLVPSKWMAANLVVPDGPRAGGRWDPLLTPYVAEIVDCLGPETPHNMVAVRKSAQTGVSVAAIGLTFAYIAGAPARIGYAVPTIDALQEFNREKLQPAIAGRRRSEGTIRAQTSRSATGSTTGTKSFPGGSLRLINANSAPDLRSKTLKIGVGDEVDEWEDDLDGQGDPWDLLKARFIAFHATGDWKLLALSTPTIAPNVNGDGGSRIEALFRAGDQRFWHVDCPGCGAAIVLEFKQLQFERKPPHKAFYAAQCCGHVIEHFEKATLVRCGRFIATNPDGLYPSFHVDALISQITTWDKIAEEWVGAQGKERKEKSFYNLWLGLPYEVRGDAPDYQRLMERREDYPENIIPPLGLILVVGADVQHNGIWVEIVVYAPDKQSWCISKRFLEGDTTDPTSGAFADLAKVYEENFQDSWGQPRKIDGMAVDAGDGGRANQVYLFCRGRHKAHAVKGMPGWGRAPIGTPTQVGIRVKGNVVRGRTMLWPVGTWDLKAEFYADLRKDGKRDGQEQDPPGYCHFGKFATRPTSGRSRRSSSPRSGCAAARSRCGRTPGRTISSTPGSMRWRSPTSSA